MKAIKTIRTYAPRILSTSEAKEMISESLFTRKMAFKVAGKRTSKAEFERSAEGTTTQIIMTKKLNLYCMGDGNEETRFHLTFNVVIMPEVTTEETTTEELDTFVSEVKKASKPKTSKVGGLSQNSKVEPTVSSTEKVVKPYQKRKTEYSNKGTTVWFQAHGRASDVRLTTEEARKLNNPQTPKEKVQRKIQETKYEIERLNRKLKIAYNKNEPSEGIERSLDHHKSYLQALNDILILL